MNTTTVPRIGVGEFASEAKMISDMSVAEERIDSAAAISELTEGLMGWNTQNLCATDNVHSRDDRIERHAW